MDTKEDHTMLVHYIKDKSYSFKEYGKGLYYINISNLQTISLATESGGTNYSLLL